MGNFPIGGGVGGARNLSGGGGEDNVGVVDVGECGVGVAVDGDGAVDAGDVGVVEGDEALTGKGESAIISRDGSVGGA